MVEQSRFFRASMRWTALFFFAACTSSLGESSDTEAIDLAARSSDVCQREGRYSNGRCDADCPLPDPDCTTDTLADVSGGSAPLCLAYRGNGPRIPAHFGATARVIETYGLPSASAGGSSGSISAFLLESVHVGPAARCSGCSQEQRALRAALAFKTMPTFIAIVGERDEVLAAQTLARIAQRVQADGVPSLLSRDGAAGVAALQRILTSPDVRDLVNPEVLELLRASPDPAFHARDLVGALRGGLSFEASDPSVFVRPGLVDFGAFADRVGIVADFYAGYGPIDRTAADRFFADCSAGSRGQTWAQIASRSVDGQRCDARFRDLVGRYLAARRGRESTFAHRVDERVGAHLPTLVTTAVLEGPATATWRSARADYLAARPVRWDVRFEDVGIGYFGRPRDLGFAIGDPSGFRDEKTRRARALGHATWRQALGTSPAEPGLSRGVELAEGRISVGGWSDLQPTLVLRNMGCERIVFVTRRGGAGGFTEGMARLLGASQRDLDALFGLESAPSSYFLSVRESDAVSCSDWDAPPTTDVDAIVATGWNAPFEATDPFFAGARRIPTWTDRTGLAGCTLGVGERPRFPDLVGHPAATEILALADRGVVAGFPDGQFRPNEGVTRAQLASMIHRAFLGARDASSAGFRDVPTSHWARRSIDAVAASGFMRGYPDGTFGPDRSVTREEVLVALAEGLMLTGGSGSDLARLFPDGAETSRWAADRVAHAERNGLLGNGPLLGAARRLRPRAVATRAEVASLVYHAPVR